MKGSLFILRISARAANKRIPGAFTKRMPKFGAFGAWGRICGEASRLEHVLEDGMKALLNWRMGAAVLALTVVAGCGSTQTTTATTGEQLTDLNQALESGAITWEEYSEQKEAILDKND